MLKSLEISGFKSFGKKAVISIDAPITSVVGPNGSGKSNVVESIRFVLGEQSMKSLRGKGQSDLLFKGSKGASPANRLKVSIVFDNKKRTLSLSSDSGKNISLDFDTVTISRELYADGKSVYSIQGSEVRLKDVTDLLSSVHIGASGHHIISQGEADRLLSASAKDRRSMIDDALGLRVYELRIRDAERKLEKSKQNITEIEAARRELAPHLKFLEKQVEKLNQAEEARRELSIRYFNYEKSAKDIISVRQHDAEKELFKIEEELVKYPDNNQAEDTTKEDDKEIIELRGALERLIGEKAVLMRTRETLERSLGRTEGLIEALKLPKKNNSINSAEIIRIKKEDFKSFFETLYSEIELLREESSLESIKNSLASLVKKSKEFALAYDVKNESQDEAVEEDNSEELENAISLQQDLRNQIEANQDSIKLLEKDESEIRISLAKKESDVRMHEAESYKARVEAVRLKAEKQRIMDELERVSNDILMLKEEKMIFEPFLVYSLENENSDAVPLGKDALHTERRALERLRMKLEDIGGGSSSDIVKEYEETKTREEYLRKELNDVNASIGTLLGLINELRETVRTEFARGIEKINSEFGNFFRAMFGGGNAFLSLTQEVKKSKDISLEIDEEALEGESDDSSLPKFERGVEIHVDLPNKKVKELSMLSGGERSLVSIALLFAMSQVNPPPFLVLDETDAALDEANSRRYGDMLERLSKSTQLLVVTHNRETMSRAGTIYGVTMGSDAVSKLLSIEFSDAIKVAK